MNVGTIIGWLRKGLITRVEAQRLMAELLNPVNYTPSKESLDRMRGNIIKES
jgi:hypothetical protein